MLVITVARKPLEGTIAQNVTKHGTGALNIDGARLDGPKRWPCSKQYNPGFLAGGAKSSAQSSAQFQDCASNPSSSFGRWPANFILQHTEGCRHLGMETRRVNGGSRTTTVKTQADGAIQFTRKPEGYQKAGYANGSREMVESWACVEGCPTRALDHQGGVTTSQIRVGDGGSLDPSRENWRFTRATGGFEDSGGVSRFFKQVGGQE